MILGDSFLPREYNTELNLKRPFDYSDTEFYESLVSGVNIKEVIETRKRIAIESTSLLFPNEFIHKYSSFDEYLRNLDIIGPILKSYGFDLKNPEEKDSQLKVLQIGSGPVSNFTNGVTLDSLLRKFGAQVTNLDILPVWNNFPKSEFIQGCWFEIDKYIDPKRKFDVIFVDNMNPTIDYFPPDEDNTEKYVNLLKKTFSFMESYNSLFMVGVQDDMSFYFPDYVHKKTEEVNKQVSSIYLKHPNFFRDYVELYKIH